MAKVVTVMNFKGGVGKTTISMNLGWALAKEKRVLLIDLDPQFNLSQYLLGYNLYDRLIEQEKRPTVYELFEEGYNGVPVKPALEYIQKIRNNNVVHIIPSKLDLFRTMQTARNANYVLNNKLEEVKDNYDIIILDCPPTMSVLSEASFFMSDFVLIPIMPEYLCTIGLPLLYQSINIFNQQYANNQVGILGAVINGIDGYLPEGYNAIADIQNWCNNQNIPLFDTRIWYSRSYPKGARVASPISGTSYARWDTIVNFNNFVYEFKQKAGII